METLPFPDIRASGGRPLLSKTLFVQGMRCRKLLWYRINRDADVPKPDSEQLERYWQANEVGLLARRLYPNGTTPPSGPSASSVERTASVLHERRPIFEASFECDRCYARVDILVPIGADEWEIVEVKSTTKVKDEHDLDVGIQAHVVRRSGLKVSRCSVLHLNPNYVRNGKIELNRLFVKVDVTQQVSEIQSSIEKAVPEMFALEQLAEAPEVKIGPQCDSPDECPLHDNCWVFLPLQNVTELVHGRKKKFDLLANGVVLLRDIPPLFKLSRHQQIQKDAAISSEPHVNQDEIRRFLNSLKYPRCYFDFETFATAVPMFNGLRPWQAVPFQFSVHAVEAPGSFPQHAAFLAEGQSDPRPEFLGRLKSAIGDNGSLIAYHAAFEIDVLKKCAEAFPEHAGWIARAIRRVVDLELPFRHFSYYAPQQTGRTTLKLVMPAMTSQGYDDLAICNGDTASLQFLRITFGDASENERGQVRRELLQYCGRDTEGMIWIVAALERDHCSTPA